MLPLAAPTGAVYLRDADDPRLRHRRAALRLQEPGRHGADGGVRVHQPEHAGHRGGLAEVPVLPGALHHQGGPAPRADDADQRLVPPSPATHSLCAFGV